MELANLKIVHILRTRAIKVWTTKLVLNRFTQSPPDSDSSATDEVGLCMDQPQGHGGKASNEPLIQQQQQQETVKANERAPTPPAQDVVKEPQTAVEMMPTTYRVCLKGRKVCLWGVW